MTYQFFCCEHSGDSLALKLPIWETPEIGSLYMPWLSVNVSLRIIG